MPVPIFVEESRLRAGRLQINIRVPLELKRGLAMRAAAEDVPMTSVIVRAISREISDPSPTTQEGQRPLK